MPPATIRAGTTVTLVLALALVVWRAWRLRPLCAVQRPHVCQLRHVVGVATLFRLLSAPHEQRHVQPYPSGGDTKRGGRKERRREERDITQVVSMLLHVRKKDGTRVVCGLHTSWILQVVCWKRHHVQAPEAKAQQSGKRTAPSHQAHNGKNVPPEAIPVSLHQVKKENVNEKRPTHKQANDQRQ